MQEETNQTEIKYEPESPLTILDFQIEGYKRVRNIKVTPRAIGVTKLGGKNTQGKTSCLDAISHCLLGSGQLAANSSTINDKAEEIPGTRKAKARMHINFTDGTIVERRLSDKNQRAGVFEVSLPNGQTGSAEDINSFISKFALCPPNLEKMTERERLKWFLGALDIDLDDLDADYTRVTKERQALFTLKQEKQRHADDLPTHEGVPTTEIVASEVMAELQKAMDANSKNNTIRHDLVAHTKKVDNAVDFMKIKATKVIELKELLERANSEEENSIAEWNNTKEQLAEAEKNATGIVDIQTDELEKKLKDTETMNIKIRENITKSQKIEEAAVERKKWVAKETEQNDILRQMKERVKSADCPLPSISVNEKLEVVFDGRVFSDWSGMQRKIFEVAISQIYNGNSNLVLCDGLEAMDQDTQVKFHKFCVSRGLQVISTEVASEYKDGDDGMTKLIIEDGQIKA